jgi:hypothetical protein
MPLPEPFVYNYYSPICLTNTSGTTSMAPSYSELKKVLDKYAIGHDVTEGIIANKKTQGKKY